MAWTGIGLKWRAWAALVALGCILVSATAALRAMAAHKDRAAAVPRLATGYEAEDHFPGAALLYAATYNPVPGSVADHAEQAAPAPGSTGTVTPPPEPALATSVTDTAATVVAARPFALGHAAALDRGRAMECLAAAVYYEAGNQGEAGERAVAQVVLNRVRHPAFPDTVCGVVYQGSEHAGCQFSFACDGSMDRPASHAGQAQAMRIAADALAGQVFAPVGLATHYHTYAVTPSWNRALVMTDALGAHLFHRWKGYWGTAAAFHQRWSGVEPPPGPHPRSDPAPSVGATLPVIAAVTAAPVTAVAAVPSLQAEPAGVPTTGSLPDAQILDRWKDSGRPLH